MGSKGSSRLALDRNLRAREVSPASRASLPMRRALTASSLLPSMADAADLWPATASDPSSSFSRRQQSPIRSDRIGSSPVNFNPIKSNLAGVDWRPDRQPARSRRGGGDGRGLGNADATTPTSFLGNFVSFGRVKEKSADSIGPRTYPVQRKNSCTRCTSYT